MDDLTITRLCAEAYFTGDRLISALENGHVYVEPFNEVAPIRWDPLHDDAQAMALVKNHGLTIRSADYGGTWCVECYLPDRTGIGIDEAKDLNRAICECVARMQQAKK